MGVIIIAAFIIGAIFGIAVRISVCDDLKDDRDYWEREAKKYCAQLGEIRLLTEREVN